MSGVAIHYDKEFTITKMNDYQVTSFYKDGSHFRDKQDLIAEYHYYKGVCDYRKSWGFDKGSMGEARKSKAHKLKKSFFSLEKGWYNL